MSVIQYLPTMSAQHQGDSTIHITAEHTLTASSAAIQVHRSNGFSGGGIFTHFYRFEPAPGNTIPTALANGLIDP